MALFNVAKYYSILFLVAMMAISGLGISQNSSLWLVQSMMLNIMENKPVSMQITALANMTEEKLQEQLYSDSLKKTFWIYLYNSAVQLNLTDSASRANEKEFFGKKVMNIAGHDLSLYDIENGMLRKSRRSKFRMYRSKWFVSDFEKSLRVSDRDWRVFFALNTGVVNDPMIWFYSPENLDMELGQQVARYFIRNRINNTLTVSPAFKKYLFDAGGNEVIDQRASNQTKVPTVIKYKVIPGTIHFRKFPSVESL